MLEMDLNYKEKQLQQISKALWPEALQKMLDTSIQKSVAMLQNYAMQETPVDQGRLRGDFKTNFKKSYWRLFNPTKYAIYVHEWTRPHFVKIDKIEGRANRHWISAGALQHAIATRWTKANPFMDRAVERGEDQVDKIFSQEIDKMFLKITK